MLTMHFVDADSNGATADLVPAEIRVGPLRTLHWGVIVREPVIEQELSDPVFPRHGCDTSTNLCFRLRAHDRTGEETVFAAKPWNACCSLRSTVSDRFGDKKRSR